MLKKREEPLQECTPHLTDNSLRDSASSFPVAITIRYPKQYDNIPKKLPFQRNVTFSSIKHLFFNKTDQSVGYVLPITSHKLIVHRRKLGSCWNRRLSQKYTHQLFIPYVQGALNFSVTIRILFPAIQPLVLKTKRKLKKIRKPLQYVSHGIIIDVYPMSRFLELFSSKF